jgi:cytochrome c biogenesis protein
VSFLRKAFHFLERVEVASIALALLMLASLWGPFLPRAALLPYYALFLLLAALPTLVCTLGRLRAVWRRTARPAAPIPDELFAAPGAVTLPPIPLPDVQAAIERQGYRARVASQEEGCVRLRADRYRFSELATLVTHLAVLLLLLGYGLSGWLGWREPLTAPPGDAVEIGRGTGLAVRNDGFSIARYPDGRVSDYRAQVALLAGGAVIAQGDVRVNEPLRFQGLKVYLSGYQGDAETAVLTLLVVRDPGRRAALAGGGPGDRLPPPPAAPRPAGRGADLVGAPLVGAGR